jgi:hypothetical protein
VVAVPQESQEVIVTLIAASLLLLAFIAGLGLGVALENYRINKILDGEEPK